MSAPNSQALLSARKRGLWMVLGSIAVIVSAVVALKSIGFSKAEITALMNSTHPLPLCASVLSMMMAFVCMGQRWYSLFPAHIKAPASELTALICSGLLLNYAAPGPVGELGSAWFAHRRYKFSLAQSLSAGVTGRLMGLITAAALGVVMWLCFPIPIDERFRTMVVGGVFLAAIGAISLAILTLIPSQLDAVIRRLNPTNRVLSKVVEALQQLCEALSVQAQLGYKAYLKNIFWSLAAHFSVVLSILLIAMSMNADFSMTGLIFTYTITTAAAVLLFALPGSYIGWDALFLGLLITAAGFNPIEAAAIALVVRLQQFVFMLLGGLSLGWLMRTTS